MKMDFSGIKVLLIGDLMIDTYTYCTSNRMSPEAPVPVLNPKEISSFPGGAGNVAMNLRKLGGQVSCVGCIGNDSLGLDLIDSFRNNNINTDNIYFTDFKTISKNRYYSNDKQVMRIDLEEVTESWEPPTLSNFSSENYDVIILSDYNKGVLNNQWFTALKAKNVIVDPKKDDFSFYSNADIITPNLSELKRASNVSLNTKEDIIDICKKMINKFNFKYIVSKRSEKGIIIIGRDNFVKIIHAHKVDNPDVTGAGDTVISTLSLAYTKYNNIVKAAEIANAAAAIVVGKKGTATASISEIQNLLTK